MHEYYLHHGSLSQYGAVLPILSAYGRNGVGAKHPPKLNNLPLSFSQASSLWKLVPNSLGNNSGTTHNDMFSLAKLFGNCPWIALPSGAQANCATPTPSKLLDQPVAMISCGSGISLISNQSNPWLWSGSHMAGSGPTFNLQHSAVSLVLAPNPSPVRV